MYKFRDENVSRKESWKVLNAVEDDIDECYVDRMGSEGCLFFFLISQGNATLIGINSHVSSNIALYV